MTRRMTVVGLLVGVGLMMGAGMARAERSYLAEWNSIYGARSQSAVNAGDGGCALCHDSDRNRNAYAEAWASAGYNFAAIENVNSDGDPTGSTNIQEILAGTQPGWAATTPGRPTLAAGTFDPVPQAQNQPPVLAAVGNKTASEGTLLTFTVTSTDPENHARTISASGMPTGMVMTPGANGSATFSWTPTFAQGRTAPYPMTITVTDAGSPAASDAETINITVGNVNQPPVLAAIGNKAATEGTLLTFTATASDPDGNALSFAGSNLPTGATVSPTGVFSWTPSFAQSGSFTMTITVTDNGTPQAASDSETITVSVGNVNRPPVLGVIGARTANVGQPFTLTATATDPDGGTLIFSGASLPAGATVSGAGVFSWTPTAAGTFNATIIVTDAGGLNDQEAFTITVGSVNRPPVLNTIGARTVNEGQPLTFTATASDPDGGTLTFSATGLPAGATLSPAGVFSWTPTFAQAGNHAVTFRVTDGALADTEAVTITVGNVNRPPVLATIGNRTVTQGQTLTFSINATDPDGDPLGYSVTGLPVGATLTDNHDNTATFAWTPAAGQTAGSVTVSVRDATLQDAETFTITVQATTPPAPAPTNRPPVLTNPGNKTVTAGQRLAFNVVATDPDGNALTFTLSGTGVPAGALSTAGAFSWTPSQAGTYPVTVTARDNGTPAMSASQSFTITVLPAPVPPPSVPPPAPVPTVMSLRLEEAEWDDGRLEIEGRVRPGGVTVTIIDADTKQVLGTVRADRDGEFETKLRLTKSPCRVQVKAGSLTSATRRVEDARGCWSRSRHEEDD